MPRGRKRKAQPIEEEAKPLSNTANEEEEFVDIDGVIEEELPYEETFQKSSNSIGEATLPVEIEKEEKSFEPSRTKLEPEQRAAPSKRGQKKRKLPPPRLVTPEEQSPPESRPKRTILPRSGARTRAMAVHDSVVGSSKKIRNEDPSILESEIAESGSHLCESCGMTLFTEIELLEHQRGFHKELVKPELIPTGTLLCSHPHCSETFPDVSHLIAHLVAYHSQQQFRIRKKTFDSIDKFWDWKNESERINRCKFMGTSMPEGTSTEIFEFTNYCEFCDDWREQDLKGPPVPEQIPKKIFGCPAYFTATIDNKKKRATIIGCLSHLGHHKKNTFATIEGKVGETRRIDTSSAANIKCELCDMMFRSRSAATRHHRVVHRPGELSEKKSSTVEPKPPSLECSDPECNVFCDSMVTLVAHVAEAHNAEVEVNEYKFENMTAFESWKNQMESQTTSRFCKVSGRVLPNEITKYYLCHLSGHTNRTKKTTTPTEKQRNRPTKKMGRYCTAFMSFKQNKIDGTIHVRGCLKHFGHPLDVRRLPIPDEVRKLISEMLLKGMLEEDVVQHIRTHYNENERGYWIQRYEVRNIALKLQRDGLLITTKGSMGYVDATDGQMWDDMGFPEENPYMPYVPVRTKLVQYKGRSPEGQDDRPTHSRYVSTSRPKMVEQMEVVQYVEDYDEDEEEQLVTLEDGDVFYHEELEEAVIEDDGTHRVVVPIQEHVVVTGEPSHSNPGARKRMPLLKEPMKTGNPAFDDVMAKMKNRFNKISQQLKVTQDVRLAHGMLKELKDLQQRMGVGHNDIVVDDNWNDDYVYVDDEYQLEQVEREEDGYDEYIDDNVVVHVEAE